ncbi:MAG: hypothetical protein IPL79_04645 [Myxococcales bacterium]|nr:hypothetical protein [Myxococcales bacterium]
MMRLLHASSRALGTAVGVAVALSGCIALPEDATSPPASCQTSSDCPSDQICLANQCYGDPPGGAFGVVVSPAGASTNASQASYPNVFISGAGELGTYALADTIVLPGALATACDACVGLDGVQALLTLSQRSAFVGGPSSYTALPVDQAALGVFQFSVAAQSAPAQTASLAITPMNAEGAAWSAWLPSTRIAVPTPFSVLSPLNVLIDGQARRVVGRVVLSNAAPAVGYEVSLHGRFATDRAGERISAVVTTNADGEFSVPVSPLALSQADLVVAPGPLTIAPTYKTPIALGDGETVAGDVTVTITPSTFVTIEAAGYASSGTKVVPEAGRVIIEAQFDPAPNASATAMFRVEVPIDATGPEVLQVPTDAATYYLTVIHAGAGEIGSLYRKPVTLAQLKQEHVLPSRTSVVGRLMALGEPVAGATLTLVPSVGTLWSKPPELQAIISAQAAAATLTAPDGSYVLWVDTSWHDLGNWRLSIVPPEASPTPLPRWATVLELGAAASREIDLSLPSASAAHARAIFPNGRPAEGARITLYRVNSINPCLNSEFAPPSCELPEVVVASGITDANGDVLLVIPNSLPAL